VESKISETYQQPSFSDSHIKRDHCTLTILYDLFLVPFFHKLLHLVLETELRNNTNSETYKAFPTSKSQVTLNQISENAREITERTVDVPLHHMTNEKACLQDPKLSALRIRESLPVVHYDSSTPMKKIHRNCGK